MIIIAFYALGIKFWYKTYFKIGLWTFLVTRVHSIFTFSFSSEPDKLSVWMNDSNEKSLNWQSKITNETNSLEQEASSHGDMLLLDVVDTYRNIPAKMLQFYEW